MQSFSRTWLFFVFAACATAKPATVAERPVEAPVAPVNTSSDDDVAQAFAPTSDAPRAVKGQAPPPLPDPRKPFLEAMALRNADQARAIAETLTGLERWKAHELTFTTAQGDPAKAAAALAWHLACGPEKLEACRAASLAALARLKPFAKKAATLRAADLCVAIAESRQKPTPCLNAIERTDDVNLTRVAVIKALAEPVEGRRATLLEKAIARTERVQCAAARRKALAALIAIDQAGKHVEAALTHSLKDLAIAAATLPEAERSWARTAQIDQLCAQYEATAGQGACRKLEKQSNGGWTFRDFSTTRSTTPGLNTEQVKQVGEHYAAPLQACLSEQAKRLVAPDQAQYEVRWVVFNDGRVGEVHLQPDFETSPFAACLRRQFSLWRYPRFEGEWQNVAQTFTVSAVTRVEVSEHF